MPNSPRSDSSSQTWWAVHSLIPAPTRSSVLVPSATPSPFQKILGGDRSQTTQPLIPWQLRFARNLAGDPTAPRAQPAPALFVYPAVVAAATAPPGGVGPSPGTTPVGS